MFNYRLILTDLNPDELHYYPFIISLHRLNGSCKTLTNLSGKICIMKQKN